MVERKVYTTYTKSKDDNSTWGQLIQATLDKMNAELSSNHRVISVDESFSHTEMHPVESNSDTWYTRKEYKLVVFCEKISHVEFFAWEELKRLAEQKTLDGNNEVSD